MTLQRSPPARGHERQARLSSPLPKRTCAILVELIIEDSTGTYVNVKTQQANSSVATSHDRLRRHECRGSQRTCAGDEVWYLDKAALPKFPGMNYSAKPL
ncbi:MAG: hypothetical protein R2881_06790 [Eubacteriales bacterium]